MPLVSVIFGTYNRFESLKRCIEAVRSDLSSYDYEIVVTDGGSTDGSREWLASQPDVVLVGLRRLGGAVEAFNFAYRASCGEFIVTLNDDARPMADALHHGLTRIMQHPQMGQLALLWERYRDKPARVEWLRAGKAYANFGIARREAVEQVVKIQGGLWNPNYRTYGADCELSAWMHFLGWEVGVTTDRAAGYIEDHEIQDALRQHNYEGGRATADGQLFWKRWAPQTEEMLMGTVAPLITARELHNLFRTEQMNWQHVFHGARKVHSQFGEDGILERIFSAVGVTNKILVDIGAHDGYTLSNTRLFLEQGWSGLLFDGEHSGNGVNQVWIDEANICELLETTPMGVAPGTLPKNFDLLSIDIDGIDWYVLRALLRGGYRPRVFVCELNSNLPAEPPVTIHYDPAFRFSFCDYFGASLGAWQLLGTAYGYTCIYAHEASNAFFVLDELLPAPPAPPAFAHRRSWGPDPAARPWRLLSAEDVP